MFYTIAINTADLLTWIAFAILLAVLVAAELYVHLRGLKGTLVAVESDKPSCVSGGAGISIRVKLPDGKVVDATANPCGLCAGNLKIGDRVTLVRRQDNYVLALPLVSKK
ncbi:MAG: hypothetical protein E3J72_08595 [Planctomycetota bacterium]|nr:MAG: hypothetical protein E3J72_08595 [Planctomycetota bacterium]